MGRGTETKDQKNRTKIPFFVDLPDVKQIAFMNIVLKLQDLKIKGY